MGKEKEVKNTFLILAYITEILRILFVILFIESLYLLRIVLLIFVLTLTFLYLDAKKRGFPVYYSLFTILGIVGIFFYHISYVKIDKNMERKKKDFIKSGKRKSFYLFSCIVLIITILFYFFLLVVGIHISEYLPAIIATLLIILYRIYLEKK